MRTLPDRFAPTEADPQMYQPSTIVAIIDTAMSVDQSLVFCFAFSAMTWGTRNFFVELVICSRWKTFLRQGIAYIAINPMHH
jgi:hypothetical protein